MDDGKSIAFDDQFWSDLEHQLLGQIASIDRRVDELYRERDRLTAFLKDHGRRYRNDGDG